jgi:hypothetical protein
LLNQQFSFALRRIAKLRRLALGNFRQFAVNFLPTEFNIVSAFIVHLLAFRRPSGNFNLLRRDSIADLLRPVREATLLIGSLLNKASSQAAHGLPAAGGRVPRDL